MPMLPNISLWIDAPWLPYVETISRGAVAIMRLQGYDDFSISGVWIVIGISILVGLFGVWRGAILFRRWLQRPADSPKRLWNQLVRIHQLSGSEAKSMAGLAKQFSQSDAVNLFVDSEMWNWETTTPKIDTQALARAFEKVFGMPAPKLKSIGTV